MANKEVLQRMYEIIDERGLPESYFFALAANAGAESMFNPTARQKGSKQNIPLADYLAGQQSGRGYGLFQLDDSKRRAYGQYLSITGLEDGIDSQVNFVLDDIAKALPKEINQGSVMGHGNADRLSKKLANAKSNQEAMSAYAYDYEKAGTLKDAAEMQRRGEHLATVESFYKENFSAPLQQETRMADASGVLQQPQIVKERPKAHRFSVDENGFVTINLVGEML